MLIVLLDFLVSMNSDDIFLLGTKIKLGALLDLVPKNGINHPRKQVLYILTSQFPNLKF